MAKVKENINNNESFTTRKPHSIDTAQFEYTATALFTYGGLATILATVAITYAYLLVQKIKS